MKKIVTKVLFAAALTAVLPSVGVAQTWNFEADYATSGLAGPSGANPSSPWTLMFQPSGPETDRNGIYAPLTGHGDLFGIGGLDAWQRNAGGSQPWIGVNLTGGDPFGFLPAGSSFALPGDPSLAVIRWTAPAAGSYDIGWNFTDLQGGSPTGSDVSVQLGPNPFFAALIGDLGTTGPGTQNLSLTAGQSIDWIVGAFGNNAGDVVRVQATVTAVPEPQTLALGLVGLGIAVASRLRKSAR